MRSEPDGEKTRNRLVSVPGAVQTSSTGVSLDNLFVACFCLGGQEDLEERRRLGHQHGGQRMVIFTEGILSVLQLLQRRVLRLDIIRSRVEAPRSGT